MAYAARHAFGSSVGRTFGSHFSGYRGDYSVYQDEPWKLSLRKYPYPIRASSPARRARSVSPRRRNASTQDAANRHALQEILARIDTTQEDLHALARKVAAWSREAASLSAGLQEEALLLDLSRQADELAASEAQSKDLLRQERVYRLSMENSTLRQELRELIRICKLLLDRRGPDPWRGERSAGPTAVGGGNRSPPRQAWQAEGHSDPAQQLTNRRASESNRSPPRAPSRPPSDLAGGGGGGMALPDFHSSHAAAAPPPMTRAVSGRRQLSYDTAYDAAAISAGLEGLTDENAPYVVASDRAQADADVDADPNRLASRLAPPPANAAGLVRIGSGGGSGGGRYGKEVLAQAAMYERDLDRNRRQVGAALTAADAALDELTLKMKRHSGSGSGAAAAATINARAAAVSESLVSMPTFGGFLQQEQQEEMAESTPSLAAAGQWQGPNAAQEVENVLVEAERELADATAEEAAAAAAADAAAAAAVAATAAAAAAELSRKLSDGGQQAVDASGVVQVGTPVKMAEGVPSPSPQTPVYHGVPYGSGGGGGGAPSTVRRERPRQQTAGVTSPLDSVLLAEVEKLKQINKALASTLHSYHVVADRLSDVAMTSPAAAGAGASRVPFVERDGDGSVDLVALAAADADYDAAASAAATYARSSPTTTNHGYASSYRLGVPAAAPSTPPPAVRHMRPEEPYSSRAAQSTVPRERMYGTGSKHILSSEARRLDSALDSQLYGIRQQLQALRHGMIADRLSALAASVPGGAVAASLADSPLAVPAALRTRSAGGNVGGAAADDAAAAAASSSSYRDAVKLAHLQDEIAELRLQMQYDRRWYHDNLASVVSDRTAMFRDLQRRIDRLMSSAL